MCVCVYVSVWQNCRHVMSGAVCAGIENSVLEWYQVDAKLYICGNIAAYLRWYYGELARSIHSLFSLSRSVVLCKINIDVGVLH